MLQKTELRMGRLADLVAQIAAAPDWEDRGYHLQPMNASTPDVAAYEFAAHVGHPPDAGRLQVETADPNRQMVRFVIDQVRRAMGEPLPGGGVCCVVGTLHATQYSTDCIRLRFDAWTPYSIDLGQEADEGSVDTSLLDAFWPIVDDFLETIRQMGFAEVTEEKDVGERAEGGRGEADEPRLPSLDAPIHEWRKFYDLESARHRGKMDYKTFANAVGLTPGSPNEDWMKWYDIAKALGFKNTLAELADLMGLRYDWVRKLHSPKRRVHSRSTGEHK